MSNILKNFKFYLKNDNSSEGIAAVKCLRDLIKTSSACTIQEYHNLLENAISELAASDYSIIPIKSGSELLLRYITFSKLDSNDFNDCKMVLLDRANKFVDKISKSSEVIAKSCYNILQKFDHILLSGGSSVVWKSILTYVQMNPHKKLYLYIIESKRNDAKFLSDLLEASKNLNIIKVSYSSLAYFMDRVEVAFVGAEAVVGSGGIINELGTLNVAIIAKTFNVPFYVCTESFKFTRFYPLSQRDIPAEFKYQTSVRSSASDLSGLHPRVDYTPPQYIDLLITDIGFVSPSGVSEELIKLYL